MWYTVIKLPDLSYEKGEIVLWSNLGKTAFPIR